MRNLDFLYDPEWRRRLLREYVLGEFGETICVWADASITRLPAGTIFQADIVAELECPGLNNLDTSELEEGVGHYDENCDCYRWEERFQKARPEIVAQNSAPEWRDIIIVSLETGDWTEWEENLVEEILRQVEGR